MPTIVISKTQNISGSLSAVTSEIIDYYILINKLKDRAALSTLQSSLHLIFICQLFVKIWLNGVYPKLFSLNLKSKTGISLTMLGNKYITTYNTKRKFLD